MKPAEPSAIRASLCAYRVLLCVYSPEFRELLAQEQTEAFLDRCRDVYGKGGIWGVATIWPRTFWDVMKTAIEDRWEQHEKQRGRVSIPEPPGGRDSRMDQLLWDFRFALRRLVRQPALSVVVILTLALGIGASTAIFSVVDAVMIQPLPFGEPERIVRLRTSHESEGRIISVSYPDYQDWAQENRVFDHLAAFGSRTVTLTGSGPAEQFTAGIVSAEYFRVLGVAPVLGRDFLLAEDDVAGEAPVVIISDSLWRDRFGGDQDILGRKLRLNDANFEVVGVMPPGFGGFVGSRSLWVPMSMYDTISPATRPYDFLHTRDIRWHAVVGRLGEGVAMDAAREDMARVSSLIGEENPESNQSYGVWITTAYEELIGNLELPLFIVSGGVIFLLLLACANVANLLLARATLREKEIAICAAMGARTRRLVRQVLSESAWLAIAGASVGLLVALGGLRLLEAFPAAALPYFATASLNWRVLAFSGAVAIVTVFLTGVVPAYVGSRTDPASSLQGARSNITGHRSRLRDLLVVAQVAIALVLVTGAGLMVKSFDRISRFEPGFPTDDLMAMEISIPALPSAEETRALLVRLLESLEGVPGVESAGFTSHLYFREGYLSQFVGREGEPEEDSLRIDRQFVSPGYFDAMGIPIRAGRGFIDSDDAASGSVTVVSTALAELLWPGQDPLGRAVDFGEESGSLSVVGVVGDVVPRVVWGPARHNPQIYTPAYQAPMGGSPEFVLRMRSREDVDLRSVRTAVAQVHAEMPVSRYASMGQLISRQTARTRIVGAMIGLFAAVALVLATLGVYAVVSYTVARRTGEFGVRMALGAAPADIVRDVVGRAVRLTGVGAVLGTLGAYWLTQFMSEVLFGVGPRDLAAFVAAPAVLIAVAIMAGFLPARRATRIGPVDALRHS